MMKPEDPLKFIAWMAQTAHQGYHHALGPEALPSTEWTECGRNICLSAKRYLDEARARQPSKPESSVKDMGYLFTGIHYNVSLYVHVWSSLAEEGAGGVVTLRKDVKLGFLPQLGSHILLGVKGKDGKLAGEELSVEVETLIYEAEGNRFLVIQDENPGQELEDLLAHGFQETDELALRMGEKK